MMWEQLEPLRTRLREIQHLASAGAVLSWDQETYMPSGAGQTRAEQLATLQGLAHQMFTSSETEALLAGWLDPATETIRDSAEGSGDERSQALLREVWRDFSRAKKLPTEFVKRLGKECSIAQQVWAEARKRSDFGSFLPHLRTLVALKKEEAHYLGFTGTPYNALLDAYEPGMTVETLIPLFTELKERLVLLLNRIQIAPNKPDEGILYRRYDKDRQVALSRRVLEAMGYDFARGRLDLSTHPFTTAFHPTDVRLTTRVYEEELPACLFSCIHEGGHGLYEQGLNPDWYGTPLGEAVSMGIHESQSRFWENCIGRSRPFWQHYYPILQETFPEQLKDVDLDRFYRAINTVKPSLIRVEADELTYNLHIMLRVELELDLMEDRLRVEELPESWNTKMKAYLGIVPRDDGEGVLQDVHWSLGAFGYFPTYTLGNLYAAQLYEQARQELPDLDEKIAAGQLATIRIWLREKVHQWGRLYTPHDLVLNATGTPLSPKPFLAYLTAKVQDVYSLPDE